MATEQATRPRRAARPRPRERTAPEESIAPAPAASEDEVEALSGERVGKRITPLEWALFGAFTIIGAIMRFWDLGYRALHHDESLHATYSWYLWQSLTGVSGAGGYHYDPMMHGPYQFHGNALMFLLLGPSEFSARANAAICGTALILVPFLLRRQIGRVGALILSACLAFSPAFLYYSRFTREDIYFALWTALLFAGFIRWLDARGRPGGHRWLYLAAAGFALSWATFESVYFSLVILVGFVLGIFIVAYLYQFLAPARPAGKRGEQPAEHPLVAALGDFSRANLRPLLDAFRGTPATAWLLSLGIMALITIVMFWPIGAPWQWGFIPGYHTVPTTNAQNQPVTYNTDFLTGGLSYWKLQQGVARGSQPWYYYFLVIPLYEQVAVVFGAAGLVYYFLRQRTRLSLFCGAAFVLFTLLTLFVGPGLSKGPHYLLALLMIVSGVALLLSRPRSIIINLLLWWTVLTWALYIFAGEKMPWLTIHILLPTYTVAALYLAHLFRAPRRSAKWLVTAALLALCALVSFRGSVALSYADGANPTEMLVYVQTAQDVPDVSNVIAKIPDTVVGTTKEHVWVDNDDTWPWAWYLRNDPTNHGLSSDENSLVSAAQQRYPVIFISSDHHQGMLTDGKLESFSNYSSYEFKLRWWFPEDGYRAWENIGLGGVLGQAVQPSSWATMWNWWLNRTPFDQQAFKTWSNVYPFFVYIRKDLVNAYVPKTQEWTSAHQRAAAANAGMGVGLQDDVTAKNLVTPIKPLLTVQGATLRPPMNTIRDVAVDKAGNLYLADSASQRIVKLDSSGRFISTWGSTGTGNGQFGNQSQGPMGIAVAPNGHVYVSDTWNHRIEEFTPDGGFVRAFGGPNPASGPTDSSFFGPRQLAVGPNGDIYVADTGNERIQVYSPTGVHLRNIGAGSHRPETALGRLDEPSGVAVDQHGIVYVADYWDKRIQLFKSDGTPLKAYPISGWASGDYSEPYLAVDKAGHLFATDGPASINTHVNHVLELDAATGRLIRAFGSSDPATALVAPSGVAVSLDGALYIADTGTIKLFKVQP